MVGSHEKTAPQCLIFKETLGKVNLLRQEMGVVQLYSNYICDLVLGGLQDMTVASKTRSHSHASSCNDDTDVGANPRSRSKSDGSSSSDDFETDSENDSL